MQGLYYPGKLSLSALAVAAALVLPNTGRAEDTPIVEFNPSILAGGGNAVDLSRFSRGGSATPGTYRTRVLLNGQMQLHQEVIFREQKDGFVTACLTSAQLAQLPLLLPHKTPATTDDDDGCVDLSTIIPEAKVNFDSSEQSLDITVPQVYVSRLARGTVPPSAWDSGIAAALLGYNVSAFSSESYGRSYSNVYAGVNGGFNIGSWYLRHNGNWSWNDDNGSHYQSINTYLQRDLASIKGRVLLGQSNTTGRLFDTVPFTGVRIDSDERMEPQSRRGYAPEVRGIARTSAQVTVRQNGNIIYETTVSPGEFVINDLYPTGYGGDLDVTVREADGSEQHFQVPFSSVTQLLRPGASRYEFVAGELNSNNLRDDPMLLQGTWQQGVNNWLTAYGGMQGSEHYLASQVGGAVATPLGAISIDVTHARSEPGDGANRNGESYRISYSKHITETRSNFSLAAYRFSTSGFMDFMTAMRARDAVSRGYDSDTIRRTKSRFTLTASQGLPEKWGQLFVSASIQNYWNASGNDKQYQVGYSNNLNRITWGVNAGRTYSVNSKADDTIMLTLNMPLGSAFRAPTGRLSYTNTSDGRNSWQAGVSGTAGAQQQFNYGVTGTTANHGTGSSGSLNGQYRSSVANISAGYNIGRHYSSVSGGLFGTVIGHSGGITLSPYQGDTFALVEAKGAEGARVGGHSGVYVDRFGYAAVPYLNPYQMNDIVISLDGTAAEVELDVTSQKVAPRDRAVVRLNYNARRGRPLLINATFRGLPLAFGAEVRDKQGNVVGYVGQGGQLYARVADDSGWLAVSWGGGTAQRCRVRYQLTAVDDKRRETSLQEFSADCRRGQATE